ncbi:WXG100 family type VII secretion target [Nocardia sp. CA-129566]|uniref:WXG100 family type VII secretion target n=1 Tax=Nocardia sp. CA-129566 TaxID=3239976 RepID=UPI003D9A0685
MSGYEPTRINDGEHSDSWEHPDIKDAFNPLDPTDAVNQAEKYWKVHQDWEQGVETFARSIQNSIAQAWSGPAAEKSKESIQNYTNDARNLTPALAELYSRVSDAAVAISETKKALPDPVVVTWTSWAWPPHRWDLQREQSEEAEKARKAMDEYYVRPFSAMDGKIPVLAAPTSPTKSVDITAPRPGGDGGGTSSGGPGNSPGTTGSGTTGGTDGDGRPDTTEEQGEQTKPEQTQSSSTDPTISSTMPTGTDPAQTTPSSLTSTDPGKTTPTGLGTTTSPGSPGSPTGTGSPNQQSPGRTTQGVPGMTGTAGTATSSTTAAGRGASGMAGMGGMGGGRSGGKDDGSEHKIPEYLINQENTDELLGDMPTTVAGGVIGGNADTD